MGLDVVQGNPFAGRHAGDGGDLVENEVLEFRCRDRHVAAAETREVRESRVCANRNARVARQAHRTPQHRRVARVEPGRDADGGHAPHQRGIVADRVGAERLADVGIQVDAHGGLPSVQTKGHRVIAVPPCHADLAPPAIHGALP